jgi:hypothetical protein
MLLYQGYFSRKPMRLTPGFFLYSVLFLLALACGGGGGSSSAPAENSSVGVVTSSPQQGVLKGSVAYGQKKGSLENLQVLILGDGTSVQTNPAVRCFECDIILHPLLIE